MSDQAGLQLIQELKRLVPGLALSNNDYRVLSERRPVDPIKILESWNPNVNVKDEGIMTPLHWAMAIRDKNQKKIVELLIEKGADVNAKTDIGETPLHIAVRYSPLDIVNYLISIPGLDMSIKNSDGRTAMQIASLPIRMAIQKAQYKSFDETTNQKFPIEILNKMKRYGGKKTRVRKIKRRKTIRLD